MNGNSKKKKPTTKEMVEIKNIVTEIKIVFDGIITRLHRAEERIKNLNICQWKLKKE